ncbi:major facilitator superfamily domain-containing protein [Stachybotrys elegans]|uniref:Major facilitator superfamily domain-containing protein n=1 Tax=Stachybotrys elegans TaxID=80388 RepID=A0A8K0SMJ5_9HYPO|nr:major facilitator superfamily domain-containing protein [Stachybotrys elegans]
MIELIREAPLGQAIRFLSGKRLLKYPEEESGFQLPPQILSQLEKNEPSQDDRAGGTLPSTSEDLATLQVVMSRGHAQRASFTNERMREEAEIDIERSRSIPIVPQKTADGIALVDWYTTDDPANPQNWSPSKKAFVVFILCFYTSTVYCAGPIYTTAVEGIVDRFGVSHVAAAVGLSLYVLAYGVGDLLFSPLTEIPIIGRNPIYYLTFIVFWALSFAPPFVDSFGGLLALRFWMGFFGSPALANGGATIGDMYSLIYIPFGLCWWVYSAWTGPAFGLLFGGFSVMAEGWRLPMWEIVWISSLVLTCMLCLMPETSAATILLRRAGRLRRLTGDSRLQSQSEIDQRHLSASEILFSSLVRPMEIMLKDPSIFFVNLYTGYFYGVFYTFFEVFPLVFPPFYGFNLGQTGLAFFSTQVGVTIAIAGYFAYLHWYMVPDNLRNGFREQEHRLVPAIFGSVLLPIGLFIFAWTANPSVHWIAPLIGVVVFVIGHFCVMQSLFIYLPFAYPQYTASLFAGNSIWRSCIAAGAVVFARPLFINLGVDRGVSLLGGVSVFGILGTVAIYAFGKKLRARSKFAQS